jgi:serine/threonine protein kinase
VHCDLKEPNIIVSNKKRLRIIDFGLTMSVSDFYNPNINTLIMVEYQFVAAPECGAFVKKSENIPQLTYDEFVDSFNTYSLTGNGSSWYKYFIPDQAANRQLYDNMINSVNSGGLTYLTSVDAALKQDPYTLGLIILRLIDKYRPLLPSSNDNPDTVKLCRELMKGLLCPDPRQRFNIKQAIEILKQILKTPHQDPYRVNQDPPEAVEIFSAFGKRSNPRLLRRTSYAGSFSSKRSLERSLKQVNADIRYLTMTLCT